MATPINSVRVAVFFFLRAHAFPHLYSYIAKTTVFVAEVVLERLKFLSDVHHAQDVVSVKLEDSPK